MKNKKNYIPKYRVGGIQNKGLHDFVQNTVDFFGNGVKSGADIALSAIGMNNVIKDDAYKGKSANFIKGYSNVMGNVAKTALPIAASFIPGVGPMAGKAISGVQQGLGQFNPQDTSNQEVDAFGNPITQYAKYGGLKYPNGGMPMMPNFNFLNQDIIHAPEIGGYFRKRKK